MKALEGTFGNDTVFSHLDIHADQTYEIFTPKILAPNYYSFNQSPADWITEYNTPHHHKGIELIYTHTGSLSVFVDGATYRCTSGRIIVANSDINHRGMEGTDDTVFSAIIINEDFKELLGKSLFDYELDAVIENEKINSLILEIQEEYNHKREYCSQAIKILLSQIVIELVRNHALSQKVCRSSSKPNSEMVKLIIDYINKNIRRHITLDELSVYTGFSKNYVTRIFKNITDYTVIEYINVTRCQLAINLLQNSSLKIFDVCDHCGFESPSYFGKIFKKYTGYSPAEYKKNFPKTKTDK